VSNMFLTDPELCLRWRCSMIKLYRMRKADKLRSTKIGGSGPWITSEDEIRRVESITVMPTPNPTAFNRNVA
jgi:hypothetical protein